MRPTPQHDVSAAIVTMPGRTSDDDQGRTDERVGEAAQHLRKTPARAWLRRTAATCAGAVALTGLACAPAALAAPDATASAASHTVSVTVDSVTPTVPVKGDTLTISGSVTNGTSQTLDATEVGVRLSLGGPLRSRNAISSTRASGDFSYADGIAVPGHTDALHTLAPHATRPFTLDIPVHALGLHGDGVYRLGVTVSATTKDVPYDHVVGIERTFLPWYDHAGGRKTKTTFLWPLIDRPHMDIRSPSGDDAEPPLFRDDDLAAELAPGGRLRELVEDGRKLPVTWVVDPDLLATVDAMTRPYQVIGHDGDTTHTTAGKGSADAKQWLDELQSAVKGHQVVALPFGDPDLAAIAHGGSSVPGTLTHLKSATDLATVTVQTILGVTPRTDFAWPADGAVDSSIVGVARAAGADKIIARSDTFHETAGLSYTPTAARPIGDGSTALVADATLSDAFAGDERSRSRATLSEQMFLAQSLMIYEQQPEHQRSVVVAPQRMPDAAQARAMAAAVSAAVSGGWTRAIPLGSAADQTPDPGANQRVPSGRSYPSVLRHQELSTSAFHQIQSVQRSLNSFLVILSVKDRVTTPFGNAILGAMSTEWRGRHRAAAAFRGDIGSYLNDLTGDVHILDKQSITLSGRTATIPVTVQNSLAQQVSGLRLRLTSNQANRLDPGPAQTFTIDGGHNRSLKFRTTARANGRAWVTAQLYTRDGAPYGRKMVFQVNVTSITDTVMLVIAGGLLLLVLAGVRMYRQRKRRALAAAPDAPTGTPPNGTTTAATAPAGGDPDRPAAATETATTTHAPAAPDPSGAEEPSGAADRALPQTADGAGPSGDADPAAGRTGAERSEPGARVPEQAGDPAPDTAAERPAPSTRSEKVDR